MDQEKIKEDLIKKVEELLQKVAKDGIEHLKHLMSSGSGIVEDHKEEGCCYTIPKDFILAYTKQIELDYARLGKTSRLINHRIKNYYKLM